MSAINYRILSTVVKRAARTFPTVVVTGPRQSGKTTLLKSLFFSSHSYINLENPDVRARAKNDPNGFLDQFIKPVILDEIQYVPDLLPYIKDRIDSKRKPGFWLLTGSQNFILMNKTSESLAGRAAILNLLPFCYAESLNLGKYTTPIFKLMSKLKKIRHRGQVKARSIEDSMLRGFFPEIASKRSVEKDLWCGSYIATYLERDIRNLVQVGDLGQYEVFLRLCATRTGQILNLSELARDVGVSVTTAKRWLSMLESGYQILLLRPYYKNLGKRLIKSPKLYFNDTALAAYLLGLRDKETLLNSPHFPHLFETMIVTDFWKRYLHFGELPSLYYLRTRDGLEIDLVLESQEKLHLFEIKTTKTITPKHASSLLRARHDLGSLVGSTNVIARAQDHFTVAPGVDHYNWQDLLLS